jgi:hypothetical protein
MPNEKFAALSLAVDRPSRCYLIHPGTGQRIADREGKDPAWIDLYSSDSLLAQDARRVMYDRRLADKSRVLSPDEQDEEGNEYLAAITAGWNLRALDGTQLDVPFNRDDARELYGLRGLRWIRDQADRHAATRGNYVPT